MVGANVSDAVASRHLVSLILETTGAEFLIYAFFSHRIRVLSSIIFGFLPIFGPIIWNAITTEIANSTESLGDRDEEGDAIKYGQVWRI